MVASFNNVNRVTSSITSTQHIITPQGGTYNENHGTRHIHLILFHPTKPRKSRQRQEQADERKRTKTPSSFFSFLFLRVFAFSSSSSQNLANSEPDPIPTSDEIVRGNLRGVLDELDTLGDVLLQATKVANQMNHLASGHNVHGTTSSSRGRSREDGHCGFARGTYSGRQAARSSSSSAESEPTEWIFSTPEVWRAVTQHTQKARSANLP